MKIATLTAVVAVAGAAAAAPLVADRLRRWVAIPSVVLEILLGILLGPALLGWVVEDDVIGFVADFGLAMLMFLAGYESEFRRIRGRPLRRAVLGWLASVVLALGVTVAFWGVSLAAMVVGLALTTTALGTILPTVRDAGALAGPFGAAVLAIGTVGEFAPIVAVSLMLTSDNPVHTTALLLGFAALAGLAAWQASRPRSPRLARMVTATLGTSVQFVVRFALLIVVVMVWVAGKLGLDVLLGAFAAGIVFRVFLDSGDHGIHGVHGDRREAEVVESKLDAIGFGLLVPFFFVVSGVRFGLSALVSNVGALLLLPAFLALFLVIHAVPVLLLQRQLPAWPARSALALLSATGLPLIVVITTIGVERQALAPSTAAALVGAGLLSVLILPTAAMGLWRTTAERSEVTP
jgi:Kef-type K+ transport system membrane component KefB